MADVYSVVDKSNKSKPDSTTLTEDTYEPVPTENLYYNTVAATTDESAALHDSYNTQSALVSNALSKKETFASPELSALQDVKNNQHDQNKKRTNLTWLPVCFIVLIIAVFAVAVAVAVAYILIVGLRSDLAAVKILRSGSTSNNDQHSLVSHIYKLNTDFTSYTAAVNNQVFRLSQNSSGSVKFLNQQINSILESLRQLNDSDKIAYLTSFVKALERNLNELINESSNNTNIKLHNINNDVVEEIMDAKNTFLTTINTLTDRLASGIQDLHTFDSCAAVSAFPIQLPSGMYNIRSGNSVTQQYCLLACNGIHGNWKRIAYLNTNENPISCPSRFEVRSDTSNPPLCRRVDASKGCNSVTYPSNGMSYSQVCGTVRVHPEGTPDGFDTFKNRSMYVDGVYLTYGDSSNRNHIWTYTAATTVGSNTRGCDQCNYMKPSNMPGTNFTCTSAHCIDGNSCFSGTLWGNDDQQCFGNETFYRQLSESTTDNIEMTVCRDQGRHDEDILLSFVELYVS